MTAVKSSDVLEREHKVIQKVTATMSVVADRLDAGRGVETATLRDIGTFLHEFSEQCHHAKQERFLFPSLEARGVPASGCPIAVLHKEREKGRALLTRLDDATQAFPATGAAKHALVITLRALIRLPMADKVFSEAIALSSMRGGPGAGKHREFGTTFREIGTRIGAGANRK